MNLKSESGELPDVTLADDDGYLIEAHKEIALEKLLYIKENV